MDNDQVAQMKDNVAAAAKRGRGRPPGSGSRGPQAPEDQPEPTLATAAASVTAAEPAQPPDMTNTLQACPSGVACKLAGGPTICARCETLASWRVGPAPGEYHTADGGQLSTDEVILAAREKGQLLGFTAEERALVEDGLRMVKRWWCAMPNSRAETQAMGEVVGLIERIAKAVSSK